MEESEKRFGRVLAWLDDDEKTVEERAQVAIEAIKTFCLAGINITMNQFNNK